MVTGHVRVTSVLNLHPHPLLQAMEELGEMTALTMAPMTETLCQAVDLDIKNTLKQKILTEKMHSMDAWNTEKLYP